MKTILVVDDEPKVLRVLEGMLASHPYRVLAAGGAAEAMQLFRNSESSVDLLVTDVVMPDMNGVELAQALLATDPELRVLFIAGLPDSLDARFRVRERSRAFLPKPFLPATLLWEVELLLSRRASHACA